MTTTGATTTGASTTGEATTGVEITTTTDASTTSSTTGDIVSSATSLWEGKLTIPLLLVCSIIMRLFA